MNPISPQAQAKVPVFRLASAAAGKCLLAMGMLAAAAALIAGCSGNAGPPRNQTIEAVTVASAPGPFRALIVVANEKRLFAEQGLEVSIKSTTSGRATIDMVARGEADAGLSASVPFVMAALDNKDLRILARVYRSRNYLSIVARKDRRIARSADLAGKRIGLMPGSALDYFTELFLSLQGIDPARCTRVAFDVIQLEDALVHGDVDAVAVQHPYNSRLIARLGPQAIEFKDPAMIQLRIDLVVRAQFPDSRPDVARRFMLALQNALNYMRDHPDEAKRLVLAASKEDPAVEERMWEGSDFTLSLDPTLLSALEDEARWAMAKKGMGQERLPNVLNFIDARPLQSAQPGAVTILLQ